MSQRAIREYDAKLLRSRFSWTEYFWILVDSENTYWSLMKLDASMRYVIKPDQLFWKRGKYGLVGVNLSAWEVEQWIKDHWQKSMEIKWVEGTLDTFLIEPFVPHEEEYYIAIKTKRDADVIYFSEIGGVDVEENWGGVKEMRIGVVERWDWRDEIGENVSVRRDAYIASLGFTASISIQRPTVLAGEPVELVINTDDAAGIPFFRNDRSNIRQHRLGIHV